MLASLEHQSPPAFRHVAKRCLHPLTGDGVLPRRDAPLPLRQSPHIGKRLQRRIGSPDRTKLQGPDEREERPAHGGVLRLDQVVRIQVQGSHERLGRRDRRRETPGGYPLTADRPKDRSERFQSLLTKPVSPSTVIVPRLIWPLSM